MSMLVKLATLLALGSQAQFDLDFERGPEVGACNPGGIMVGEITIHVDGKPKVVTVAQSGGNNNLVSISNGHRLTFKHGPRIYLANTCPNSFQPTMFYPFMLLNKTLSYTVLLQGPSCGCNAAVYLISMPAKNSAGQYDPTKCGDYYCDANNVCGVGCPEMDIMEANNRVFAATPHHCGGHSGAWSGCDGGGCSINSWKDMNQNSYGYGSQFTIDSSKPFQVNTTFATSSGTLSKITVALHQSGKNVYFTFDHNKCSNYVASMHEALSKGMVLSMSFWGEGGDVMSWLDVPPCGSGEACNKATTWTLDNIVVS